MYVRIVSQFINLYRRLLRAQHQAKSGEPTGQAKAITASKNTTSDQNGAGNQMSSTRAKQSEGVSIAS